MNVPAPLFIALLIIGGSLGGWIADKCRLPPLFGKVLAGILLGHSAAGKLMHANEEAFTPFNMFALSLIAVTIGGHLEFRRLHNAKKRIFLISIFQTAVTFFLVFIGMHMLNPLKLDQEMELAVNLLLASIATSTSPVSTIHLIQDKEAKGLLVKTTIAVLAITNLLTLVIFEIIRAFDINILSEQAFDMTVLGSAATGIGLALVIGLFAGWGLVHYCRFHLGRKGERKLGNSILQAELFTGFLVTLFLCNGLCELVAHASHHHLIAPSPILANIMVGLVLANQSSFKEDLLSLFNVLEHAMFTMFYVLAGSHFHFDAIQYVGWAALLFFILRAVGKVAGGWMGSVLSGTTKKMALYTGPMQLSQGALAVSMVILLEQYEVFAPIRGQFTATVITAVVLAELLTAPIITKVIDLAGETKRDGTRLIEFLQEEYILPRIRANDKQDLLEQLVAFLYQTHDMEVSRSDLLEAIVQREDSMSTGIGHGIAVPHAVIGKGEQIVGVMGILEEPIDFDSIDGNPVRLVMMIATPENQKKRHLEVIAAVTRMLQHQDIREKLFAAKTSEVIHEIIDSEEADTFNYFLST